MMIINIIGNYSVKLNFSFIRAKDSENNEIAK